MNRKIDCDSIIFDVDGVLIDVSKSYRTAIVKTVEYWLENNFGIKNKVVSEDIEAMKKIPGFNNDWDVSFVLIELLSKKVVRDDFKNQANPPTEGTRETNGYKQIKDVFQSYYLGETLFEEIYKRRPPINYKKGLIANESLMLSLPIMESLSKRYKLGVATSRPRFEALFALRNLKISPKIIMEEYVVAQEDARREKPAPDPLLEAKKRMGVRKPIYIGDSINDSLAARAAEMFCIFIGKDNGDIQLNDVNKIKEVLL